MPSDCDDRSLPHHFPMAFVRAAAARSYAPVAMRRSVSAVQDGCQVIQRPTEFARHPNKSSGIRIPTLDRGRCLHRLDYVVPLKAFGVKVVQLRGVDEG